MSYFADTPIEEKEEDEATYLDHETKLFDHLLSSYHKFIRPAVESKAVNVSLGLSVLHINSVVSATC